MTDQGRFDLEFELVLFIIRWRSVVLQTQSMWQERGKNRRGNCLFKYQFKRRNTSAQSHITGAEKKSKDLLCEKKETIVGQTKECAAGQNYFQQMVQFPESDHLFLQINLRAEVKTLWRKLLTVSTMLTDTWKELRNSVKLTKWFKVVSSSPKKQTQIANGLSSRECNTNTESKKELQMNN